MAEKCFQYSDEILPWEQALVVVKEKLQGKLPFARELASYEYLAKNPKIPEEGIHGQRHAAGVWLHGRILGGLVKVERNIEYNQTAVDLFAIEHDRQRRNDGYDWGHGIRAARDMLKRLQLAVEPQTLQLAAAICRWHVFPEQLVPPALRHTWEWKISIHADALERTRNGQPHDHGDLDLSYLHLSEASLLVDIAREVSTRSQVAMALGVKPFAAMIGTGLDLGLLMEQSCKINYG